MTVSTLEGYIGRRCLPAKWVLAKARKWDIVLTSVRKQRSLCSVLRVF